MKEYIVVNVLKYIKERLVSGKLLPINAEKFARITTRSGIIGEEIISWSVDQNEKWSFKSMDN